MNLQFDAKLHKYTMDGRPVPGVTSIIDHWFPLQLGPKGEREMEFIKQRGSALHQGIRLLNEGRLDWGSVASAIKPRLEAWQRFMEDHPTEPVDIEKAYGHPLYHYAGTLDYVGRTASQFELFDAKSSFSESNRIQIGAYVALREANHKTEIIKNAGIIECRADGKYKAHWLTRAEIADAQRTFIACLTLFNFAKRYSLGGKHV